MNDLIKQLEAASVKLAAETFRTPHLEGAAAYVREAIARLRDHGTIALAAPKPGEGGAVPAPAKVG